MSEHAPSTAALPIAWRPTPEQIEHANVTRFMRAHGIATPEELVARAAADVAWFWDAALADLDVPWLTPYAQVLDESAGMPWTRWFIGGRTNIVHACVDRHAARAPQRTALLWEGDDGARRSFTYAELRHHVDRVAAALVASGLGPGDRAGVYMPMVPEMVFALLGCLKLGIAVVPVFSGFAAEALATRFEDASVRIVFTADGGLRRGKVVPLKPVVDAALTRVPSARRVVVLTRAGNDVAHVAGRDVAWDDWIAAAAAHPAPATPPLAAEHECLIIYTSGTTGRPKGTVHTHAGCLAQMTKELAYYFDVKPDSRFFWLTDIGWMMGPWEIIGVTSLGATFLVYEGVPDHPAPDRLWDLVERHQLTHLGISPTAVRMLMRAGPEPVRAHDLRSLRILGSTGEPWDPESWRWYFEHAGGGRCPVINITGGTEIVGCLLAPLPTRPVKPCTVGGPGLGMAVDVFDDEGRSVRGGIGYLVCKRPAPSMTKGFLNDAQRYIDTYFSRFGQDVWYHGDWAHVDDEGYWFLHGRADDTIKVAGKRTGPGEVESALIAHSSVSEAAAIGVPDALKGEEVVCFVVLKAGTHEDDSLREALKDQVVHYLGKTLRPRTVHFVDSLPKTRSGKIVRGAIKRRYLGEPPGDLSSVDNPAALDAVAAAR